MANIHKLMHRILLKEAERVYKKYPKFWRTENAHSELHHFVKSIGISYEDTNDVVAMHAYFAAEAKSKDTNRIFGVVMRETVEHNGYTPEIANYLAIWYFILVIKPKLDYDETTDLDEVFMYFVNNGRPNDDDLL